MKAIQVRSIGATNFRGARMKAWTEGGNSVEMPFQYEVSSDELRVYMVALELIDKMKWEVKIIGIGSLPKGDWAVIVG